MGEICMLPELKCCLGQRMVLLRPNDQKINPKFLLYAIQSHAVQGQIKASEGTGTTVSNLRIPHLKNLKIPSPTLDTQENIASTLSAYDDLIENNRRRIQLLEESAQLLYKEWFVHLRFPGHEHTTITDGVPEGWERKTIADVTTTLGGGTPSTKVSDFWGGDVPWATPSDITGNGCLALLKTDRQITESGLKNSSAKLLAAGTILMTSRASVGFFAVTDFPVSTNQGFINIVTHEKSMSMYLLFNLMSRVEEIRSNAKGTTFPEISKGRFRSLPLVVPGPEVLATFDAHTAPIIEQVRTLKKTIRAAAEARDLLLPRLMSGEVTV